jgi:hypothetical protein
MASLPLSRRHRSRHAQDNNPVRTGKTAGQRVNAMEIVVLLFFVLLAAAAAAGLTVDSRDSADWKPTNDGVRAGRWD